MSPALLRTEGAASTRAEGRRDQPHGAGAARAPAGGRDPERRPPDEPVLPPPLGSAGRDDGGDGGSADVPRRRGDDPDPMRVIEILSHELRSPITTIHLGTKVLREQGHRSRSPSGSRSSRLSKRRRSGSTASSRTCSPSRATRAAPRRCRSARSPSSTGCPPSSRPRSRRSPSLRVRLSIPPDLPPVLADDAALAQVVRNLLANVTRYAPDGMPAEIVAGPNDDGTIRLEVLDRGPGVEADEADTVFEPFYRSSVGHGDRVRSRPRARRGPTADAGHARLDRGAAARPAAGRGSC